MGENPPLLVSQCDYLLQIYFINVFGYYFGIFMFALSPFFKFRLYAINVHVSL